MASYYRAGRFEIHPSLRAVHEDGVPVEVGSRAFDLLVALVESRDRVLSKRELLRMGWPGLVVEENTLQVQISLLRKRLGQHSIATVPSRGYRFVLPVAIEEGPPAPQPAAAIASILPPAPRTRFVGRADTLADCIRLVGVGGLLTLTGPGGSGKTRLAIELSHRLRHSGHPVWFVDLSFVQDADQLIAAVASTLGIREQPASPIRDLLVERLRRTQGVLVLDNCEQVTGPVAAIVDALGPLSGAPSIVATSRQPLRVSGEQIYPLRSLALPASHDLDAVVASEAVQLFADRTRLLVPDFEINASNAVAVAVICERLDGIPLAIELAAPRMKILSAQQLGERLGQRFKLLVGGDRTLPRHQTLLASMQWSYELLSAEEQRTFRALSVFDNGCTLESATEICGAADEYAAMETLTGLYDKSLLEVDNSAPETRYRMLQTVRQYANDAMTAAGEGDAVRSIHLDHFDRLARRLVPRNQIPLHGQAMQRLRAEQDNLRAALAEARSLPRGGIAALRLAGALWPYWLATSQLELGHGFMREALAIADGGTDVEGDGNGTADAGQGAERALTLLGMGNIAFYRGRYREALDLAEQALGLCRRDEQPGLMAFALKLLAGSHHAVGEDQLALEHYRSTLHIADELGDAPLQASAHNNLAEVHRGLGDLESAKVAYAKAIDIGLRAHALDKVSFISCNLSRLLATSGALPQAIVALRDAHEIAERLELRRVGDTIIDVAAGLAALNNDDAVAARLNGASLAMMQESGSRREPLDEAFMAPLIAGARRALGDAFDPLRAAGGRLSYRSAMKEAGHWLSGSRTPTTKA